LTCSAFSVSQTNIFECKSIATAIRRTRVFSAPFRRPGAQRSGKSMTSRRVNRSFENNDILWIFSNAQKLLWNDSCLVGLARKSCLILTNYWGWCINNLFLWIPNLWQRPNRAVVCMVLVGLVSQRNRIGSNKRIVPIIFVFTMFVFAVRRYQGAIGWDVSNPNHKEHFQDCRILTVQSDTFCALRLGQTCLLFYHEWEKVKGLTRWTKEKQASTIFLVDINSSSWWSLKTAFVWN